MLDSDDDLLHGRTLPDPTLTLTLPSLHDGTHLDCRVYHPLSLSISPRAPPWQRHAAVVAHPYAPLGGSWDDHTVGVVASTLLRLGYLVCTFNFRGASGSAGRTSWTAKAERADYMSVAGFVAHYVHFLDPFRQAAPAEQASKQSQNKHTPVFLLAGYSYGAMITTQLPSLDTILATFQTPLSGSPAAEIRQRAQYMADTENAVLGSARTAAVDRQNCKSPRKAMAMRIGGDEQNRKSHDLPRRSFSLEAEERVRELITKARKGHRSVSSTSVLQRKPSATVVRTVADEQAKKETELRIQAVPDMTSFQPAYLLVSPLQGIVTHFATMSFANPFGKKTARVSNHRPSKTDPDGSRAAMEPKSEVLAWETEHKLINNPTLAIYGDQDIFVAAKKLRDWASRLEAAPKSRFRAHEISTAGHFWHGERDLYIMRDAVKTFAGGLVTPEPALSESTAQE